ncbi:MAG: SRPBCC family protein [Actinomycetes bacterium]
MAEAVGTLDVRTQITVGAPRAQVWDALLRVGEWWPHRFRPDGQVALEPWVGGRFLEDWGDEGGGSLYGQVTELAPATRLAVSGPMGMSGAVASRWTMDLVDEGEQTVVRLVHTAVGEIDDETRTSYGEGWGEVLQALGEAAATTPAQNPHGSLRGRARL